MNAQTKIEAEEGRCERPLLHDLTQELHLAVVETEGVVRSVVSALRDACKAAEDCGVDASEWLAIADAAEGRL